MRVINYLLSFTLILAFSTGIMAQRNCGSMEYLEEQLQNDPKREAKMEAIERFTRDFIEDSDRVVNGVVTIPVVVHVIYNTSAENISDAQVLSQITVLNEDFRRTNSDADNTWSQAADSEIEFCMATVDPNGNATNGITRTSTSVSAFSTNDNMKFSSSGGHDAWPASDYLNVWVCDISGGILGYAQFPGGPASTDGVVIDYQYMGTIGTATSPFDLGRTGTHEVGHWLNLRHIWGDGGCGVDDFVADTPTSDGANYGCATGHVSCGSTDMVENYMDYSDDACMNLFTTGQKSRMRALFDTGGARQSILNSNGCGEGSTPTCDDGIQNGDEEGVDCGGSCPNACPGCEDNEVTITINLDNYPEETSWTVTDDNNNTVASGGTYGSQPDGSTVVEVLCLVDGCYDFNIYDSYGDGICCGYGNGSYTVTDANNNVLASGGNFGSSESTNFCFGGTAPVYGCTNPNAHNYNPAATVDDGSCETCSDGVQNGDETGEDCGGSCPNACPTCTDGVQNGDETGIDCGGSCPNTCGGGGGCSYVDVNNNDFDNGWGIWNDGGSDCRRSGRDAAYAYSGSYCIRLRDNTSSSTMTTDNLNLSAYDELTVDFTYYPRSMENGEDFWLQVSTNGGSSYSTVASWASGTDFSNGTREFETVVISGTFASNTRLRFRCDASGNSDYIYIDDVVITGCLNSNRDNGEGVIIETVENETSSITRGIEEIQHITDIKLFPNPTSGLMNVSFDIDKTSDVQLIVTNITGQVIHTQDLQINAGEYNTEIDASRFGQGIFFLNIATKDGVTTQKFVVVR